MTAGLAPPAASTLRELVPDLAEFDSPDVEEGILPTERLRFAVELAQALCAFRWSGGAGVGAFDERHVLYEREGARSVRHATIRVPAGEPVAERYMAPEIAGGGDAASCQAFLFSLGVLVLRICHGRDLEGVADEELFRLWEAAPAVAKIVDDLTVKDPARRARAIVAEHPAAATSDVGLLKAVADKLGDELRFTLGMRQAVITVLAGGHDRKLLLPAQSAIFSGFTVARMLGAYRQESLDDPETAARTRWLRIGAIVSVLLFYVEVFFMFIPMTLADFGAEWTSGYAELWSRVGVAGGEDPLHHLDSRLVALSFAFIAITYYFNLFATLDVSGLRGGRLLNLSTRWLPITLNIAIVCGMLGIGLWPFVAALGMLSVLFNNLLWTRFVDRTHSHAKDVRAYRTASERDRSADFARAFREWYTLMRPYVFVLALIAALLHFDISIPAEWLNTPGDVRIAPLEDEGFFVLLVALGGNMVKLYGSNVRMQGPSVAGNIARMVFLARRIQDEGRETGMRDRLADSVERLSGRIIGRLRA